MLRDENVQTQVTCPNNQFDHNEKDAQGPKWNALLDQRDRTA